MDWRDAYEDKKRTAAEALKGSRLAAGRSPVKGRMGFAKKRVARRALLY